jgi:hypothetical protein
MFIVVSLPSQKKYFKQMAAWSIFDTSRLAFRPRSHARIHRKVAGQMELLQANLPSRDLKDDRADERGWHQGESRAGGEFELYFFSVEVFDLTHIRRG